MPAHMRVQNEMLSHMHTHTCAHIDKHYNYLFHCHICGAITRKTTNKSAKFAPFARPREMTSTKLHSIESRLVIGPSKVLFVGVHVCIFQPGNFTGCGSEGVKLFYTMDISPFYQCRTLKNIYIFQDLVKLNMDLLHSCRTSSQMSMACSDCFKVIQTV